VFVKGVAGGCPIGASFGGIFIPELLGDGTIPSPSMVQLRVFVKDMRNELVMSSHVFAVQFIYF
jgi:hypothetical protein